MQQIENSDIYTDLFKPTDKIKYNIPCPELYEEMRDVIITWLPLKIYPKELWNIRTQFENVDPSTGVKIYDIPWAEWVYPKKDLRKHIFTAFVYKRDPVSGAYIKHKLGSAKDIKNLYSYYWEPNFTDQQRQYYKEKHPKDTNDARHFRGFGSVIVVIDEVSRVILSLN